MAQLKRKGSAGSIIGAALGGGAMRERKNSGFLKEGIRQRHASIHQHPILQEGYLKKKSSGHLARWQERYTSVYLMSAMYI